MDNLARTLMTLRCRDCDDLPKVADAGRIIQVNGQAVQVMHNGVRVIAEGYHGDWMAHVIRGLRGHHEPQEELIFHSLLKFVRHNSLMVELGSFWAYYTLWYLQEVPGSHAICVEPDPEHMAIGRKNTQLNDLQDRVQFVEGWVGGSEGLITMPCESTGEPRTLPCFNMTRLDALSAYQMIELVHIDAQGAELEFIQSMSESVRQGRVRFLVVSTHHAAISGSATTHQDCLRAIRDIGGLVLVEHDVQASFSGDGLIAASFLPYDCDIELPSISRNDPAKSLFPVP